MGEAATGCGMRTSLARSVEPGKCIMRSSERANLRSSSDISLKPKPCTHVPTAVGAAGSPSFSTPAAASTRSTASTSARQWPWRRARTSVATRGISASRRPNTRTVAAHTGLPLWLTTKHIMFVKSWSDSEREYTMSGKRSLPELRSVMGSNEDVMMRSAAERIFSRAGLGASAPASPASLVPRSTVKVCSAQRLSPGSTLCVPTSASTCACSDALIAAQSAEQNHSPSGSALRSARPKRDRQPT
mmetsp:Transcript_9384/g.38516  ORF Transcript_9384/g.38516 Transcript_9384/m.38516 type:complete len:245 (+) Transcript_9384:343-1077(+)